MLFECAGVLHQDASHGHSDAELGDHGSHTRPFAALWHLLDCGCVPSPSIILHQHYLIFHITSSLRNVPYNGHYGCHTRPFETLWLLLDCGCVPSSSIILHQHCFIFYITSSLCHVPFHGHYGCYSGPFETLWFQLDRRDVDPSTLDECQTSYYVIITSCFKSQPLWLSHWSFLGTTVAVSLQMYSSFISF